MLRIDLLLLSRCISKGLCLAAMAIVFEGGVCRAVGNPVCDPSFATVGKPGGAWQIAKDQAAGDQASAQPAKLPDGATGVQLKSASVTQEVNLPEGPVELTVQASGQGELTLGVQGIGERTQSLTKGGGLYGYLFEAKGGRAIVSIGISVDGVASRASLLPATADQKAAWKKQQAFLIQFGYASASAQRPTPGGEAFSFAGASTPLAAMTRRAVLDDGRLDTCFPHVVNHQRAVGWLAANGFERVDADRISAWMEERIKKGDAYGSVAVITLGSVTPAGFFEGDEKSPRWLRYLRAGGRLVQVGNVPLIGIDYAVPTPTPCGWSPELRGVNLVGLRCGWDSPYWGQYEAVAPNPAAKSWGFETVSCSINGFPVEGVSLAFDLFTVKLTGKKGTANFFKNVRPDLPWSGFIHLHKTFDGNNDAQLRDVLRAALYVGKPIAIPTMPPLLVVKPPRIKLATLADGMKDRREFVRGEKVRLDVSAEAALGATAVGLELLDGGKPLWTQERTLSKPDGTVSVTLDTSPYAYKSYLLKMIALQGGRAIETRSEKIGIRYMPPEGFNWQIGFNPSSNPTRRDLECRDVCETGFNGVYTECDAERLDTITRHGLGFSYRAHPDLLLGKELTFEKNPEYFKLGNDAKGATSSLSGGRPSIGISHPDQRAYATKTMREAVRQVAQHPGFRPYVLTNDDWSRFYGWDYSAHVLADFKAKTGLDAPRKMETPKTFGPVPDNHPWLRWFDYCLREIDAAMNKAEADGVRQARADARTGPIPGGMQVPLVQMWEPSQYPPYSFGPHGFDLICSYYYNTFWQPIMTVTFWMEIGRMGNRELPQWNMPDCLMTAGYSRNNLFHYLAGGVNGLAYYDYTARTTQAWPEFRHLSELMRRIGPVQLQLKPARRAIGMLNSFTSNCFDPSHTLVQTGGYHRLMQGHFDLEMVAEEEILTGRAAQYKAIVLHNVKYLRKSVYDALVAYAAKGGLVLLDAGIPFKIPGAKRLHADIGAGDYGLADHVVAVQKAMAPSVKPWFDCPDIHVVATRMEAGGVPYTWFVNAHDGKEFMFCRKRIGAGYPGAGSAEKIAELQRWEEAEMARGPFAATITLGSLPGAVPYDLVGGRKLDVKKLPGGRFALSLSMERFGGSLVAWLPEEIGAINVSAPSSVKANEAFKVVASIVGKTGRKIPGALVVEFTLEDPSGHARLISGVRAAIDGTATWEWTPAVNDPAGCWKLRVRELSSGSIAKVAFQVR